MRKYRRMVGAMAVAGAALALAACGGSSSDNAARAAKSTTTTSAGIPGTAKITSFDVPPSASCPSGATSMTVSVNYGTTGAKKQVLYVDGRPQQLDAASGAVDAPVHCDAVPHTFVIVAYDANGRQTAQEKKLVTTT